MPIGPLLTAQTPASTRLFSLRLPGQGRKGPPTPIGLTDLYCPQEGLGALILVLAEAVALGVILRHWTVKGNSYHEMEYLRAEGDLGVTLLPACHWVDGRTEVQRVRVNCSWFPIKEDMRTWQGRQSVGPNLLTILPPPLFLLPSLSKARKA